jgi:general secretion pathway protein A
MYNAFFGFDLDPFRVNPDPRFLYFSESHREALATLIYAVQERKGFIVLTGEVGTGKTTVLNAMLQKVGPEVQTAYLFNTKLSVEDFFSYLFDELELDRMEPYSKSEALHRLNQHLIERLRKGQQTLLIIDEAQNLSNELLEEIRMLSNLETPQSKLLQIVLVGQPELDTKLGKPELRQLRQRVELRHSIRALGPQETAAYVRERLLIAGHDTGEVFTPAALRAVHDRASGIPRIINVLCDNALLIAFGQQSLRIAASMVDAAARDLGLDTSLPMRPAQPARPVRPARRDGWLRRLWSRGRAAAEFGL